MPIKILKSVEISSTRQPQSRNDYCPPAQSDEVNTVKTLIGFDNAVGDCELDTDNRDKLRLDLYANLDWQPDKLTLETSASVYEGGGNSKLHAKYSFPVYTPPSGWRIRDRRWQESALRKRIDLKKQHISTGKHHGEHDLNRGFYSNTFLRNVRYEFDGPGNDCNRSKILFDMNYWVQIEQLP